MITVVYITSNREIPEFEEKIKGKLLEVVGDNKLISVSQKPINFGENICVGDIGQSYKNADIQLLTGARAATTEYIAIAESDQLYPPGFFDFQYGTDLHYMYDNLWVLRTFDPSHFKQKEFGEWVGIVNRKFFIKRVKIALEAMKDWKPGERIKTIYRVNHRSDHRKWEWFTGLPVITVKTPENISPNTGIYKEADRTQRELPHWGKATDLSNYLRK
jgi:hypothetical protein